ncbi:UNVERIFIED_ORG: hypothetical protein J2W74_002962 [Methylorubrum zatmanii]|nr:hypothetical protein [Methylorubrum extorquens]MCP1587008.1 hypothetical protein [Methylorubrum extorquens]
MRQGEVFFPDRIIGCGQEPQLGRSDLQNEPIDAARLIEGRNCIGDDDVRALAIRLEGFDRNESLNGGYNRQDGKHANEYCFDANSHFSPQSNFSSNLS